jgi:hypothetical protein
MGEGGPVQLDNEKGTNVFHYHTFPKMLHSRDWIPKTDDPSGSSPAESVDLSNCVTAPPLSSERVLTDTVFRFPVTGLY